MCVRIAGGVVGGGAAECIVGRVVVAGQRGGVVKRGVAVERLVAVLPAEVS